MMARREETPKGRLAGDASGAFGDLGTFLPYTLGAVTIAGLAPAGVFVGYGLFMLATGLFYSLPIAVQPMKVMGAALVTGGITPAQLALGGIAVGALLVILGVSGLMVRLGRLIPQSVTAGLQLGLGLAMVLLGLSMIGEAPWLGLPALGALLVGLLQGRLWVMPAVLVTFTVIAVAAGLTSLPAVPGLQLTMPMLVGFELSDLWPAFDYGVLPQLPLTLTNAVLVTAVLARDLFPDRAGRVSERNLSLSSGFANLVLCPIGAMPMCHGAGGLQAQVRFGASSGLAPILLGCLLLLAGLLAAESLAGLLTAVPSAAIGGLLVIAGLDLALSRRLFDARAHCWPAILVTAAGTVMLNPALGLLAGWLIEAGRSLARSLMERLPGRGRPGR
jgi:predicted benzoate:H+ symporter BenE